MNKIRLVPVWLYMIYYGATGIYMPYISLHLQDTGLSGVEIGTVLGLVPVIAFVAPLFWGRVSRGGRELAVLSLVLAGGAAALLLLLPVGGLLPALCAMAVVAFFINAAPPLLDGFTVRLVQATEGQYGRYRLWGSIGYGLGGLAASGLTALLAMQSLFVASILVLAAGSMLAYRAHIRNPAFGDREPTREAAAESPAEGGLLSVRFVLFLAVTCLLQISNTFYGSFFGIYLDDMGAGGGWVGLAVVISSLFELPFFYYASAMIRRTGAPGALVTAASMYAVRWFLLGAFPHLNTALLTQTLHGVTFCLYYAAAIEFVSTNVHPGRRTEGLAAFTAACTLAGLLGNILNGMIYDNAGLIPLLYVSAGAAGVSAAGYLALRLTCPYPARNV
jgi:MFS transporter, PPP family, 3-phenylpropionic acid transporter